MEPALSTPFPPPPVCAMAGLSENSRLGFRVAGSTLHQGLRTVNYLIAVGDTNRLVRNAWPESLKAQQQNGDPTLPTAEAPPPAPLLDRLLLPQTPGEAINLAIMVGTDGLGELAEAGAGLAEAGETLLTRYGTKAESTVERLAGEAAKAEEKIGIHGVSTTAKPNLANPGGTAAKSAVESSFKVVKTLGKNHWTVALPKPVTETIVQVFNSLFWP